MKATWLMLSILTAGVLVPVTMRAQSEEWAMKMDDAQEAKDDLLDAVGTKSGPKAAEATEKILKLLAETKAFWEQQKMPDVVKTADGAIAAANEMAAVAKSGKMDNAKAAYDKLNAACNVCHDLHAEERVKK
ncbi:MAG: cytochrome c [Bryobacteraceae bacterium]